VADVVVRRATVDDAGAIARIHVRAWQAAYRGVMDDAFLDSLSVDEREAAWRRRLPAPPPDVFVAERDGRIAGWMCLGHSRDGDAAGGTGELWAINVDPDRWTRGVGQALWAEGKAYFRRAGFDTVTLWCARDNPRALRFYAAAGFQADGAEQTIAPGGKDVVEIRLRCALPAA
jgi:ribosomal protein S18 acetylase RimI-like enzyme